MNAATEQPARFTRKFLLVSAILVMMAVCVFGLVYQSQIMWVLCPQSLVVMFVRQAMGPIDSLGAAHIPDLAVAAFYYPIVGKLLFRGLEQGAATRVIRQISLSHLVAIVLAIVCAKLRNSIWSGQLGN